MNKSYVLALLPMVLIMSCTSTRRGVQSPEVIEPKAEQKTIILYPETKPIEQLKPVVIVEPKVILEAKVIKSYPKIVFTSAQSANVKHSDNTLPKSGMRLDLDQLSKEFAFPCVGEVISEYGIRGRRMHAGIDVRAKRNDTIRAVFDGVVRHSRGSSTYGNVIVIRHYNGLETVYSHNTKNLVKANDIVKYGDPISLAGRTGRATTEHLHFEVRVDGEYFNPRKLIDFEKRELQKGYLTIERSNNGKIVAILSSVNIIDNVPVDKPTFSDSKPTPSSAGKVYHKIVSGDTLYGLALKYKTTVANICKLNNITKNTTIQKGKSLRIK